MELTLVYSRDLQTRKELRQKAWQLDGWAETVSKVRYAVSDHSSSPERAQQTSKLAHTMDSYILSPLDYSPLK